MSNEGELRQLWNMIEFLVAELEYTTATLDHMNSDAVSREWRRKWPQQREHVSERIGRNRQIIARAKARLGTDEVA
jgi:hypothetical protein